MRRFRTNRPSKDIGVARKGGRSRPPRVEPFFGRCEDCKQQIMMVRHIKPPHKWCPLDLNRHEDANIRVRGNYYEVCPESDAVEFRRQGVQMFKNHIIVCAERSKAKETNE